MLEAMILQTLNRYPRLPGHARLIELAATPVSTPEVVDHQSHHEGTTRAIEFEVDGTVCLYSRGTAAGSDAAGDNGFSKIMRKLLIQYRPRNLYVATFSRLVRSHYFAHEIFKLLSDYRIILHDGSSDPIRCWTPEGRLRWQMLVMFVDMEREAILMRLTLGRLARHRRGEWIQTFRSVPFGYQLRDRKLEADPAAHDAVNKTIRLIGTPGLDMTEMLRALGDIGVAVPVDSGGWSYDPNWRWDGTAYVPERNRRRAGVRPDDVRPRSNRTESDLRDEERTDDDGAFMFDPELDESDDFDAEYDNETGSEQGGRPRRRLIHQQGDSTQPARRLMRYLDLWETGELHTRLRSPLDVDAYADYAVTRDSDSQHDLGYIELVYRPDPPPVPWATPGEFSAARAAVEHRLAQADRRPDTANIRMPFLGQIGRWTDNENAYAILSPAGGGRRPSYTLYSQPNNPDGPRRSPNGALIELRWKSRGRYLENITKVLTVAASDLHTAISITATDALHQGLTLTPSRDAPPTFLGGDNPRRRRNLGVLISECEDRAQTFLREASRPDAEPAYVEFCERNAREEIGQAQAHRTELNAIDDLTTHELPPTITIDTTVVARVLAGLRNCTGRVSKTTANLIRDVITDLRLTRDGPHANFSFYLRLPAEDGIALAGPITGRLPQSLGSDQPGNLDHNARGLIQTERARELARILLTTDTPVSETIRNHPTATGASDAERAHQYLVNEGLTSQAARAAMAATPLPTRRTVWALLHGEPADHTLDPAFVDHIRHTYIDPGTIPRRGSSWLQENAVQKAIFDRARQRDQEQQPPEPDDEFKAWAIRSGLGENAAAMYVRRTDGNHASYKGSQVARIRMTEDNQKIITLLDCPHCQINKVDAWAKVHENNEPIMCSNCRRSPDPTSPVYPIEYLQLSIEEARRRVLAVNPVVRHDQPGFIVSVHISKTIYEWANANNLWVGPRRVVTKLLVEEYYLAIVEGRVHDPAAVRDWAERTGHATGTRGRVPQEITEEFILTVLLRNRKGVREWASQNGRILSRSGAELPRLMLDYASHMRHQNRLAP